MAARTVSSGAKKRRCREREIGEDALVSGIGPVSR
jgi:hypothetical protein